MKKAKEPKEIESVELKVEVLDVPRIGMLITKDNLTIKRYHELIYHVPTFEKFFTIKYKRNEPKELETKK